MSKQQKNETRIVKAASRQSQVASLTDATRQLMVESFRLHGGTPSTARKLFEGSWVKRVFSSKQPTLTDIMKSLEGKNDKASSTMLAKLNKLFTIAQPAQEKKRFRILVCANAEDSQRIIKELKHNRISKQEPQSMLSTVGVDCALFKIANDKQIQFWAIAGLDLYKDTDTFARNMLKPVDMVICTPDFQNSVFEASKSDCLDKKKKMTALVVNAKESNSSNNDTGSGKYPLNIKETIFTGLKQLFTEEMKAHYNSNEDINARIQNVFALTNNAS